MPKKVKKLDPEQLKIAFQNFKDSHESQVWDELIAAKLGDISDTTYDIIDEESEKYFELYHKFMTSMKIPHKTKLPYNVDIIRTMFIHKDKEKGEKIIDKKSYEATLLDGECHWLDLETLNEAWNARAKFFPITDDILQKDTLNEETYLAFNKALAKKMTEFDKAYIKYSTKRDNTFEKLFKIVKDNREPLEILIIANHNYALQEKMDAELEKVGKLRLPIFRTKAVLDVFVKEMNTVSVIFHKNGRLDHPFDTQRLLDKLQIADGKWDKILPFNYYLSQLHEKMTELRDHLTSLYNKGSSHWYYEIIKNDELNECMRNVLVEDDKCENMVGDKLKQDQLKFVYDGLDYMCKHRIFRDILICNAVEETPADIWEDEVIPKLTTFRTLQWMNEVNINKEIAEAKEKAELLRHPKDVPVIEEFKLPETDISPKRKSVGKGESGKALSPKPGSSPKPNASPRVSKSPAAGATKPQQAATGNNETSSPWSLAMMRLDTNVDAIKEQIEDEAALYGREMIWENYVDENMYDDWKETAKLIPTLNQHVLEDIEDYLILSGFKPNSVEGKKKLDEEMQRMDKSEEETRTLGKLNNLRAPFVWNFFLEEDSPEKKYTMISDGEAHMVRLNADPFQSYKDGRVEGFLELINKLSVQLKKTNQDRWKEVIGQIFEICKSNYSNEVYDDYN